MCFIKHEKILEATQTVFKAAIEKTMRKQTEMSIKKAHQKDKIGAHQQPAAFGVICFFGVIWLLFGLFERNGLTVW